MFLIPERPRHRPLKFGGRDFKLSRTDKATAHPTVSPLLSTTPQELRTCSGYVAPEVRHHNSRPSFPKRAPNWSSTKLPAQSCLGSALITDRHEIHYGSVRVRRLRKVTIRIAIATPPSTRR